MPPIVHGPESELSRLFARYLQTGEACDGAYTEWQVASADARRPLADRYMALSSDLVIRGDELREALRGRSHALVVALGSVWWLPVPFRRDGVRRIGPAPKPDPPPLRLIAPRLDRAVRPPASIARLGNATFVATAADVCELKPPPGPSVHRGFA